MKCSKSYIRSFQNHLIIILLAMVSFNVAGQTIIPGGNINGVWNLANSPYIVQGNVTIQVLQELEIEPGVVVKFQGNYRLTIKGVLMAVGTADQPITFTKNIPGPGWEGLRFEYAASGSQLIHCIIEYGNASGGFPNNVGGGTYMVGNAPVIRNCVYRYNVGSFGGAIFSIASSPVIEKCVFYGNACGNFGGAIELQGGLPKVYNCTFYDNSADAGGAIYLENCDAEIQNTIFFMNDGFGAIYADAYSTDAQVKYCDFSNNPDGDFQGYKPPDFGVISTQNFNGDSCDVYFNIFLNPEFTGYQNNDFSLLPQSPCIDAGNPVFPFDPDGTRIDMGAFSYYQESSEEQVIQIPQGWSGISGYIQPDNPLLDVLLGPIMDELVVIYGNEGVYWPGGGANTLTDWNALDGYIIKVSEPVELMLEGDPLALPTLSLSFGWNVLPVLSSCSISLADFFGNNNALVIVKEIAGTQMYWPEMEIFTLTDIEPGKAYLVYVQSSFELSFPGCDE